MIELYSTINVVGALHAGGGITKVNKFLSIFGLPVATNNTFKLHERIIGPFIEEVAKESCIEAVLIEKELTEANLENLKKNL